MKIKILVPKNVKTDKWKIVFGNARYHEASAADVYNLLEKKIKEMSKAIAHHLIVDYDSQYALSISDKKTSKTKMDKNTRKQENGCEWFNDITTKDQEELLYATMCFIEDYVSESYRREKLKKYGTKYGVV